MYSAILKKREEEQMRKQFRAICRFRTLVRKVIHNLYWLIDNTEQYEGLENVKRRVDQAVRSRKTKHILNIQDKALLNKPASERSEQEQKYIYKIIGNLKCFKRYPDDVKRKLAAVTYFKYYGPNRVIVRQNQVAHATYFVVTGNVSITILIPDPILNIKVPTEVGQMHAGDMFGEVSLLHNINRTATCTTIDNCEFLALMKEDFKSVLLASLQQQWDEVMAAVKCFSYFDKFDEVGRREACIVGMMKSYKEDETILGDGVGVPNYVYFVLSGACQLVETLQLLVYKKGYQKLYKLHDPFMELETIDNVERRIEKFMSKKVRSSVVSEASITMKPCTKTQSTSASDKYNAYESDKYNEEKQNKKISFADEYLQNINNIDNDDEDNIQPHLKTVFMQACIFRPGSTFGLGESMRDRRIVATARTDCMLLPKMWLLQRNISNIWTRIPHYLNKKIPSKQKLFKEYLLQRRWREYSQRIVNDVISKSNVVNFTTIHDVPYFIRIQEMSDI